MEEFAEKERRAQDYYQKTPMDVILGPRSKITDELFEDWEREEQQQALEDMADEEYEEELSVK